MCEQHERERAKRSQLQTRSSGSELVYKVNENARPQPEQHTTTLDDAAMLRWNAWFDDSIMREDCPLHDVIAEALSLLRQEFAAEIASLRADMNVQTGIARGEIKQLQGSVPPKRDRNVA
jgi:hypothetical protein